MGGGRDRHQVQERHGSSLSSINVSLYSARLKCTSKRGSTSQQEGWGRGNAQAKEEVLLSRRGGAVEIFLLTATRGSRNLVVSGCGQDIGDDLGLEHPMVVLGIEASVARF